MMFLPYEDCLVNCWGWKSWIHWIHVARIRLEDKFVCHCSQSEDKWWLQHAWWVALIANTCANILSRLAGSFVAALLVVLEWSLGALSHHWTLAINALKWFSAKLVVFCTCLQVGFMTVFWVGISASFICVLITLETLDFLCLALSIAFNVVAVHRDEQGNCSQSE